MFRGETPKEGDGNGVTESAAAARDDSYRDYLSGAMMFGGRSPRGRGAHKPSCLSAESGPHTKGTSAPVASMKGTAVSAL